jgi:penicillin-binding protein 1A
LKVQDANGNILEEAQSSPTQAIPAQTARQISDILSDQKVMLESLNQISKPWGRQVAIKTGTTNDYRDVWIEGYTPSIVVGAWAGKNDNTPMQKKVAGLVIAPVWGAFMSEIIDSLPDANSDRFKTPEPTPKDTKPVLHGVWKGGISYFRDSISGKVATDFTPPELEQETLFNGVHSILHWVDKNNPTGPIPQNPQNDSQYEYWEHGVRAWYDEWHKKNPDFVEATTFTIPTETDDVHIPANFPKVSLVSPANNATLSPASRVEINFIQSGKYPTKKVELYVNDRYIISSENTPFTIGFTPSDIPNIQTTNTIRLVVYDSVLNRGEVTSTFSVR